MSHSTKLRRKKMYKKLKEQFKALRASLGAHLDVVALADDGIDVSFFDLYQETQGGYFLPMSQSRLESLDQRPHFDASFSMEDPQWSYGDALILLSALVNQLIQPHEETLFRGIDVTKWNHKGNRNTMERRLQENGNGDISDPIRQYDWSLGGVFDTESMPHEMCTSIHVIPNVRGPLRSELMIILGLMGSRLRRKHFQDQEVFPLLMLSVIGRNARIIHAYICPDEQRLKVHYSQLFDFSHYTSAQADLFIRWLMSDPILPEKPISEGDILSQVDSTPSQQSCSHDCVPKLGATLDEAEEPDDGSKGDKAPQVMVVETTRGPRSPRCDRDFLHASVEMSNTSMVMVA